MAFIPNLAVSMPGMGAPEIHDLFVPPSSSRRCTRCAGFRLQALPVAQTFHRWIKQATAWGKKEMS